MEKQKDLDGKVKNKPSFNRGRKTKSTKESRKAGDGK